MTTEFSQFHGTKNYYRHPSGFIYYTDNIRRLAEEHNIYWLIDTIVNYCQKEPSLRIYKLDTDKDGAVILTMMEAPSLITPYSSKGLTA